MPTPRPTLFLTVGLPGAGKTTRAKALALEHSILRLTPDEWMSPLFGHSDAAGRRDILEGRFIWVAHQVLISRSSVILDFGCWSPEERYAIRTIAGLADADFVMEYLTVDESIRRRRSAHRGQTQLDTSFRITETDHDQSLTLFQPPTRDELAYAPIRDPPAGFLSWSQWATVRWPTLPPLDR